MKKLKIDWILIYIFSVFCVMFLSVGTSGVFGTGGYPLISERPGQIVTGRIKTLRLAVSSAVTLSGVSIEGTFITGASNTARPMASGISVYIDSPPEGANCFIYNDDDTSISGNSLFVHFIDTSIASDTECTAGLSKFEISGTTLEKTIVLWASEVSKWTIKTIGSPTVEAD